jgi:hypothetical protein
MADRKTAVIPPATGETRTGSTKEGAQGVLYVQTGNAIARTLNNGQTIPAKAPLLGSVLALDGVDATGLAVTWYYFTTSAGVLRRASTMPTNTESDGSAV